MSLDIGTKDMKRAPDQIDGPVGMTACAPPVHLAQPSLESSPQIGVGFPACESGHVVGDRREAVDTRSALPCTLASQVVRDASRLRQATCLLSQHDDDANPGGGTNRTEGERRIGRREVLRTNPRAAIPSHEEGLRLSDRRRATGDIDEWSPPVDLDHPGLLDGATDRHQ